MAIKLDASFKVNLNVAQLLNTVNARSVAAVEDGLQLIEREAKILSPYETGTNRRSIEHEVKRSSNGAVGSVYTTSGYGGFLEIGNGQRRSRSEQVNNLKGTGGPTRYMYPAFEKVREAVIAVFRNLVQ